MFILRTVLVIQSTYESLKSAWQNVGFAKIPPAIPKASWVLNSHLILHNVIISTPFLKKQINVAIFQLSIYVLDDRIVRYDRESRRDSNVYRLFKNKVMNAFFWYYLYIYANMVLWIMLYQFSFECKLFRICLTVLLYIVKANTNNQNIQEVCVIFNWLQKK